MPSSPSSAQSGCRRQSSRRPTHHGSYGDTVGGVVLDALNRWKVRDLKHEPPGELCTIVMPIPPGVKVKMTARAATTGGGRSALK